MISLIILIEIQSITFIIYTDICIIGTRMESAIEFKFWPRNNSSMFHQINFFQLHVLPLFELLHSSTVAEGFKS